MLGAVAPLGLAMAAGTALVVDLDPDGPAYPGDRSLAALVAEGPRRSELAPGRAGVAVLRNGGVAGEEAADVVAALVAGWPQVVVRLPARPAPADAPAPVVPVRPLLPGGLWTTPGPAVHQRAGWPVAPDGPGPVLPIPRPRTWQALLGGLRPPPDRWLRAWREVWSFPWT